jgi:hypothetical protein
MILVGNISLSDQMLHGWSKSIHVSNWKWIYTSSSAHISIDVAYIRNLLENKLLNNSVGFEVLTAVVIDYYLLRYNAV